jgi:hypothetical protein
MATESVGKTPKSPFLVYQDFISPKLCDEIITKIHVDEPTLDDDGYAIKMERLNIESQDILYSKFKNIIPDLEKHYDLKYRGTEEILFQYFPVSKGIAEEPNCANSKYLRKKWVKVKDRDITGILWFKEYNNSVPIDVQTEVYGGKLEFPQYNFSLHPQRGTLILFPAYPHFITAISQILIGDLYCARFQVAAENWLYQPDKFPGSWSEWFKEFA